MGIYRIPEIPGIPYTATVDPLDVARRDHMEFFVESILSHRNKEKRTSAEFLVKLCCF